MKVLFVLSSHNELGNSGKTTGWYLSEASHPWKSLKEVGIEVDFVSPKGGVPPLDPTSYDLNDPINKEFWEDPVIQVKLNKTLTPEQINYKDYKAIHFVGGHGVMWDFPNNVKLSEIAGKIYEENGIVSAVCHGPAGLLNIKVKGEYLVKGKNVACFTNQEEDAIKLSQVVPYSLENEMKSRGAIVHTKPQWSDNVQLDGHLLTGQNPQSAKTLGEKLKSLLTSQKPCN
eukprot:gene2173-2673_t